MSFGPVAYYNEIDPVAAQWLRNLIIAGHIAPGWVDERSIEDVRPEELEGFTQCHFFAGIGVWSLALRRAGWPDDWEIWTGSCPCQPFSSSGQRGGFTDERHLWPAFHWLIQQRGPGIVAGEQVASKAAEPWLDLVQTDMEALEYAFGAVAFPSAGVGAPHIRDRTYWVADAGSERLQGGLSGRTDTQRKDQHGYARRSGPAGRLADTAHQRIDRGGYAGQSGRPEHSVGGGTGGLGNTTGAGPLPGSQSGVHRSEESTRTRDVESERSGTTGRLADAELQQRPFAPGSGYEASRRIEEPTAPAGLCSDSRPGPTNGFWETADWLGCRDEKWRPVRPGSFPLVNGAPARVGRLRAYGNAINVEAAKEFITAYMEAQARTR